MNIKSERLKKLENELQDLNRWLELGLVPKKDLAKHNEEMQSLHSKIEEEKERLRFLKENGDAEEFAMPKKPAHGRQAFQEPHSLPDIDIGDAGMSDLDFDVETDSFDLDTSTGSGSSEHGEDSEVYSTSSREEDDEDPFSDRNRWKRGILEDPDADEW